MDDFKPTPLASFLIKVHSRCNLMCDYCYEYNSGNTSWKRKPREMSWDVYEQTLFRVREHSLKHKIRRQFFSFHGGEPLLRGMDFFRRAVDRARAVLQPEIEIGFGTQTNGTLLTADFALAFADLRIGVGVSLDGPRHVPIVTAFIPTAIPHSIVPCAGSVTFSPTLDDGHLAAYSL